MSTYTVGIIDVFAERPLEGNPLAVVQDADDLTDDVMRRIAGEFNQAETTFILRSDRADRKLRSFTASGAEVFGAGHNALGAWLWLGERGDLGALDDARTFHQEIGGDVLPIELQSSGGRVNGRMLQTPLRLADPIDDIRPLAAALALDPGDLITDPPVRPADTGAAHLMVRVRDAATADKARPDADALLAVLNGTVAEGCYLYAFDPSAPGTAYTRFFNPTVGLWEDAATGTAAGPLAAYLHHHGALPTPAIAIEQGVKMGRRSILRIHLKPEPELSGTGKIILVGTLSL
ncbi:phenazine biosynthesis protein family [Novosphingobium sp. Rr 2-17]|uniref:PhzF family phenazine biosynthesis protein n=1 Tax=Novosphingobium sp. Rr 2-17 TaxID=555793 RepID=UPI0002699F1B|nr:PhzF family phenazine biosynthesis protein [Novosphingobium sp. Rr 2-17]EIZ77924.1 phenazine biosynthesis protein family [Novosphingobium sp. Rr 2-17]